MRANLKVAILFGLSVVLGALVWILSPALTGHREPWDADSLFYRCGLFLAGFIPACFSARRFWLWALGAWVGQLFAFVVLILRFGSGPLWLVGVFALFAYALWSLAGAGLGAGVHYLFRRHVSHSVNDA